MAASSSEQESIVSLLTRIYIDVVEIEEQFKLYVGGSDYRPRIEYFHDAVRAFTSQDPKQFQSGGRLSVELLAYDLSCLRFIQQRPLSPFTPHGTTTSPSTQLMAKGDKALAVVKQRPDRSVKDRITELYQKYSVLFAALLKPIADRDYHERVDNLNQDVEDLQQLANEFEALRNGIGSIEDVGNAIMHIDDDALRQQLMNFMHQQKHKKKDTIDKMVQFLKATTKRKDQEIAAVDKAHMDYALSQLGIFEGSKDMLKKMAQQGMNLVGKFVEASIAQSRREVER